MSRDAIRTLFHPFESGALGLPPEGDRALFIGAEPGFVLPEGFGARLSCTQGFRPDYLALQREGRSVTPEPEGDGYDLALMLCSRHRGESDQRIVEALKRVRRGGLVVVAGGKEDGIQSLRKRLEPLLPLGGQAPKHHGVAFWFMRPGEVDDAITALTTRQIPGMVDGRYLTAPGMFSSRGVDRGSRLLVDHLPRDLRGAVADFCSGWGYLARTVAERFPGVVAIDLYEADHASLQASKQNTGSTKTEMRYFWRDLTAEPAERAYDVIVMNPPFHVGHEARPELGQQLIERAAASLKPRGRLFMVANRRLPYERTLSARFASAQTLLEDNEYKLFGAYR